MINLLKKGILAGIGIGMMTKEKIEELAKKTAKEAKLNEEEGRKLADDLLKQSEEVKHQIEKKVDEQVRKNIDKFGFATKEDLKKVEKQLEKLQKEMGKK